MDTVSSVQQDLSTQQFIVQAKTQKPWKRITFFTAFFLFILLWAIFWLDLAGLFQISRYLPLPAFLVNARNTIKGKAIEEISLILKPQIASFRNGAMEEMTRNYLREVLGQEFLPKNPVQISLLFPSLLDPPRYKSSSWEIGGKNIYVQSFFKTQDNILKPLDINIIIKKSESGSGQMEWEEIGTYFTLPAIPLVPKESIPKQGGKALGASFDNPDGTKETRAFWTTEAGSVYFIACRIFPASPLFKKGTCFP